MSKPLTSRAAKYKKVELESLGFPPGHRYIILFDAEKIEKLTDILFKKLYKGRPDVKQTILNIITVGIGVNNTSYTKAIKNNYNIADVDCLIERFESYNYSRKQIEYTIATIVYNSARSSIGNKKSTNQKKDVQKFFVAQPEPYCNILICEPKGSGFDIKPDGFIPLESGDCIWVYLRYGDSDGGSQGDRQDTMRQSKNHPNQKFLHIWDGIEVEESVMDQLNAFPNTYATRFSEFDPLIANQKFLN
jgi:hypothetical protein